MAGVSVYDDSFLSDDQKKQIEAFTQEWWRAHDAGDQAGMDAAHAAAERVRSTAGYSGGDGGWEYHELKSGGSSGSGGASGGSGGYGGYTAAQLPTYQPQVDRVNEVYDAARDAQLAQLKSAYDANSATLEEQRAAIPEAYQAQRNETAAQSELSGRNFREYAVASGLNSGTGGQAELARSNQLQGDLSALGRQETAERRSLESKIAQLKIQYQNAVAEAIAQGEYDRAAALLQEYQRAQESAVTVAQAQADENYRAWSAGYQQFRDEVGDDQYRQQLEEARRQADQEQANWQAQFDYGREQDAQAQKNWQAQFDYGREQDAQTQQNWERQFSYGQAQDANARALEDFQQRLKMAQLQAQYGDYSGLQALGVDTSGYEAAPAAGTGYTPRFTWPQVDEQIKAGNLTPNVLKDYEYYTGQAYSPATTTTGGTTGLHGNQKRLLDPGQDAPNRDRFLYEFTQRANAGTDVQTLRDMLDTAVENNWITKAEAESLKVQAEANYAIWFSRK